jgi:release factor glutamine methyltransferase
VRSLIARVGDDLGSGAEARFLVAHVLGLETAELPARLERHVAADEAAGVAALVERRRGGEPLQYVLGTWEFRALAVAVDDRAFVPRPETEVVAGIALEQLGVQARRVGPSGRVVAVDLGTGSGVIALSLAFEGPTAVARALASRGSSTASVPQLEVWATDVSSEALMVMRANLATLGGRDPAARQRVHVALGPWFDALPRILAGQVHVLVSNPPYVSVGEWETLPPEVRKFEPPVALVAGPTGFEAIEEVLTGARRWLAPGGTLVVELAPHQAEEARRRAASVGYLGASILPDLAGRARVLEAHGPEG